MKIRTIIVGLLILFSASLYADWQLSGTVLTDPDTGWEFDVNLNFSYNDGKETFTGMAITKMRTIGTGVVDFRNKELPEGVTLIAIGTGGGINTCTEMHIPDTIVYIGDNAFSTRALTKIYPCFPDSVRYIGKQAFYRSGSSEFTGDGDGNVRIGCGGNPFQWGGALAFERGKFVDLTLGSGVTNFPDQVFSDCTKLQKVTFLGEGLEHIGSNAFKGCNNLTEIYPELPSTVTYMGASAFYDCWALGSLRIGGSKPFTFSGESADSSRWLGRTKGLTNVTIGAGVQLPSSGKLLENDTTENSVKTLTFEGYPGDLSKLFYRERYNYKRHFTVPEESKEWMQYLENNSYTPWADVSEAGKTAYFALFGADAAPPSGTFVLKHTGNNSQATEFVTIKKVDTTASKRILIETDMDGVFSQSDIVPELGDHTLSSGSVACSASYAVDSQGTTKYKCDGYEFYEYVDGEWKLVSSSTDKSFTFNPDKNGLFKLRWKMSPAGYKVAITYPETLGTVEITNAEQDGDFFVAGSSFTVSATATTDAPFARWFGTVAENDVSNATITVVVDAPKTIIPYFKDKWVYDGTYISDGYWKLLAKGTIDALYPYIIGNTHCISSTLATRELDLSKEVEGGRIVGIGFKAFRYSSQVDTLILPSNCEYIAGQAFDNSSITRIEPFLPSTVTNIGDMAFCKSSVRGSLVLGGKAGKIKSLDILRGSNFGTTKITNVLIRSSVKNELPYKMFDSCYDLKDVWFEGFMPIDKDAFNNDYTLNIRIHVPKGDADWNALLAEKMVAWENCTESDKRTYWKRFDTTQTSEPPLGKVELAKANQWMWVMKWTPYKRGLSVIVR